MSQSTRLLLTAGGALALVVAIGAGILGPIGKSDKGNASSGSPSTSSASQSVIPSLSASPGPSAQANIPVYPAQSAAPLTAAWDSSGGASTRFGVPAVAPDGRIWAPSSIDNAFRILTQAGKLSETWGAPGSGDGQFNFNIGPDNAGAIAFAPDGGFWVLDSGNFRVQRFDRNRKFLSSWGRFGSADGEFAFPTDIAFDGVGTVFVADDGRHIIQVFTSDGRYLRSVAAGHAGPFLSATGDGWVTTNQLPDGRAGVVEYKPDGSVGGGIDMPDLMPQPMGIRRDAQRNIYVVGLTLDGNASTLVRFSEAGQILNVWDAGGLGIAVAPAGDIAYVLTPSNATIRKYVIPAP